MLQDGQQHRREASLALEIERRFLVNGPQWRGHCLWQAQLRQGYLSRPGDGLTLRVRTSVALPLDLDRAGPGPGRRDAATALTAAGLADGSETTLTTPAASTAQDGAAAAAQAWLTLKAPPPPAVDPPSGAVDRQAGAGGEDQPGAASLALARLEFEYAIPPLDAEALLALTDRQVLKRRYGLDLPGGDWVLDVFEGANAPLVVAEVELEAADQAVPLPAWCGRELTGLPQLSNAALAARPLAHWSAQERQALLG